MKRGDIYWANLRPRSGSEQSGIRPVLIVSNDGLNSYEAWKSIIVLALSSSMKQFLRGPSVICLKKGVGGLSEDSFVICHQITTVDRGKFTEKIGTLPMGELRLVEDALKKTLELY